MSKSIAVKKPREFRSRDQWRETFEHFDAGDLTIVAFCRQQGLCVSTLLAGCTCSPLVTTTSAARPTHDKSWIEIPAGET